MVVTWKSCETFIKIAVPLIKHLQVLSSRKDFAARAILQEMVTYQYHASICLLNDVIPHLERFNKTFQGANVCDTRVLLALQKIK
eukprot:TRINITY_DN15501_c0_g1_i1.p1 TRINITY_DN15501_c0_g1~~TRINITY_DN15501_c0_g1_i1.p1  ORF type:complete len:85 (-),score=9.41 TRINITY_DN15501_c0_g1_i1:488-742(-)